jgi:hypothetical protein
MRQQNSSYRIIVWSCLALVPFAFGIYSVVLGQDTNWDLLNYHLYNPYAFLNNRIAVDLAPAGLQTYFNPFLDVAYFFAVNHLHPKTVGFLLGFIQGLNFILVYKISRHVLKEHKQGNVLSLLLALAGVLSVGFLSEVGTTLSDSVISIFPLLSLWMILSFVRDLKVVENRSVIALTMCAGGLVGIGCGLKLTISIYALSMCLSFLVLPVRLGSRFKLSFLFGVFVLVGLLVSGGFWMHNIWSLFGNPLFPQLNDIFHGVLAQFEPMRDIRFLPKTVFDKLFYPAIFTVNPLRVGELRYEQISWIFVYVAALALLINRVLQYLKSASDQKPLNVEAVFLLTFFCISYLLWLNMFGIFRYLISINLLIPLLLFVAISHFFKTPLASFWAIVFISALTAFNLRGAPNYGHSAWSEKIYHVEPSVLSAGQEPGAVYLAGQPLAWLVPALGLKTPFIQIYPNILVSEAYWQRAKSLVASRDGRSFVVLAVNTPDMVAHTKAGLAKLGLTMNTSSCGLLTAYLGSAKFEYKFCEVDKMGPQ